MIFRNLNMKSLQTGYFAALFLLLACHSNPSGQTNKQVGNTAKAERESGNMNFGTDENGSTSRVYLADSSTFIKFRDLQLRVDYLAGEQDTFSIKSSNPDTVALYYAIPETIQGQRLFVTGGALTDVKVETAYETSLTISFSGEHFDLLDWKHYTSPWKVLSPKAGRYYMPEISLKESHRFPRYTVDELEQKAIEDSLSGVYTQKEGRPIVGIGRIFVRISGTGKQGKQTYLLIFEEPMGC